MLVTNYAYKCVHKQAGENLMQHNCITRIFTLRHHSAACIRAAFVLVEQLSYPIPKLYKRALITHLTQTTIKSSIFDRLPLVQWLHPSIVSLLDSYLFGKEYNAGKILHKMYSSL